MKIKKLILHSSNIEKQIQFYTQTLGFELDRRTEDSVHFQMGETELIFKAEAGAKPYHFAFNIPSNQIVEALVWLKNRETVLKSDDDEIQDFDTWKAKAIYCHDADGNIIKLIAREQILQDSNEPFSADSVVSVSEIGIVSEDNVKVHDYLVDTFGLPLFKGNKDVFSAIGDDHGLFICMDKTKRNWFPTSETAYCTDFEVEFIEKGGRFHLLYKNGQLICS